MKLGQNLTIINASTFIIGYLPAPLSSLKFILSYAASVIQTGFDPSSACLLVLGTKPDERGLKVGGDDS